MNEESKGLWHNIHAKRKRIAKGSGEKMRKPGSEGAPTKQDFERSAAKDKKESLMTFKEYLLVEKEMYGLNPIELILDDEGVPFFLNPKMMQRVFEMPDQNAFHGISIENLTELLPKAIGKAKTISTFNYLERGTDFFSGEASIDPDNVIEAFVLVQGRVSAKFNMDTYTGVLKSGVRYIKLNNDTIDNIPSATDIKKIKSLRATLRKYINDNVKEYAKRPTPEKTPEPSKETDKDKDKNNIVWQKYENSKGDFDYSYGLPDGNFKDRVERPKFDRMSFLSYAGKLLPKLDDNPDWHLTRPALTKYLVVALKEVIAYWEKIQYSGRIPYDDFKNDRFNKTPFSPIETPRDLDNHIQWLKTKLKYYSKQNPLHVYESYDQINEAYDSSIREKMTGSEKQQLIAGYMDFQEKLMNTNVYNAALANFLVKQTEKRNTGYTEITMDNIKPRAIYLLRKVSSDAQVNALKTIPAYSRIPIKMNVTEAEIIALCEKMR